MNLTRRDLVWTLGRLTGGAGASSLLRIPLLAQASVSFGSRRPLPQNRKFRSEAVENLYQFNLPENWRSAVGRSLRKLLSKHTRYNHSTGHVRRTSGHGRPDRRHRGDVAPGFVCPSMALSAVSFERSLSARPLRRRHSTPSSMLAH
jgi:hypothetical protein